jgi:Pyridine nucleotide-disulphide oxidoreductase
VALVERDTVGGTVVTSGGAPTKTLREAAAYLSGFEKEKVYGVALSAPPEVMYPAVAARARRVSEQLPQATLERIRERGVHLVRGEARLDGEHTVVSSAADGTERRLRAERVIIATGSRPLRPAGVPFDDPCVFDSETIAGIGRRRRELLIVGGGALGRAGRLEQARLTFEKMFSYANHLGLYSEEIGSTGEQLGNFPQAFSHLSLISSAVNLDYQLDHGAGSVDQAPSPR